VLLGDGLGPLEGLLGMMPQLGPMKGLISGLGLLDIWIGLSELIQYRDYRS